MISTSATPVKVRPSQKTIIAVLLVVAFLASSLFYLARYYRLIGHVAGNNPLEHQAADLIQLEKEYRQNTSLVLLQYLDNSGNRDLLSADFLSITQGIAKQILGLKVSTNLKQYHFDLILAIKRIEQNIIAGNESLVKSELQSLREISQEL